MVLLTVLTIVLPTVVDTVDVATSPSAVTVVVNVVVVSDSFGGGAEVVCSGGCVVGSGPGEAEPELPELPSSCRYTRWDAWADPRRAPRARANGSRIVESIQTRVSQRMCRVEPQQAVDKEKYVGRPGKKRQSSRGRPLVAERRGLRRVGVVVVPKNRSRCFGRERERRERD